MKPLTMAILTTLFIGDAAAVRAQSLGDVARAARERREHVPPGRLYTEADLRPEPKAPPPPKPAASGEAPAADESETGPAGAGAAILPVGDETLAEARGRLRARELRSAQSNAREVVEALRGRLAELDAQLEKTPSASLTRERAVTSHSLGKAERDLRFLEGALDR